MLGVEQVRRFNRFYTRRIGVLRRGMVGSAYPLPQARLLYELGSRGRTTASELGAALGLDAGYLSRLIDGLRRRGLLSREAAAEDARRKVLSLTARGRKAFALLDTRSEQSAGSMLAPLSRGERGRVVEAMGTIESLLGDEPQPGKIVLRAHRAGDMGGVVERHAAVYFEEWGWGAGFEALVAGIV